MLLNQMKDSVEDPEIALGMHPHQTNNEYNVPHILNAH